MEQTFKMRPIAEIDREAVLEMMRVFYASPAVQSDGSEEIFNNDISECISDSPFASGYVFEGDDGICGYAMLAHSYSTEFGRPALWIEDIYLKESARGLGLANMLFDFINEKFPGHVHRLEAENDNVRALRSYEKNGFDVIPYVELLRNRG